MTPDTRSFDDWLIEIQLLYVILSRHFLETEENTLYWHNFEFQILIFWISFYVVLVEDITEEIIHPETNDAELSIFKESFDCQAKFPIMFKYKSASAEKLNLKSSLLYEWDDDDSGMTWNRRENECEHETGVG